MAKFYLISGIFHHYFGKSIFPMFFKVGQLFDESVRVSWMALELLDEACDDKMNLEAVVCSIGNFS